MLLVDLTAVELMKSKSAEAQSLRDKRLVKLDGETKKLAIRARDPLVQLTAVERGTLPEELTAGNSRRCFWSLSLLSSYAACGAFRRLAREAARGAHRCRARDPVVELTQVELERVLAELTVVGERVMLPVELRLRCSSDCL